LANTVVLIFKEGLINHGHEVTIVGNGDGFKKYPIDFNIDAKWSKSKLINIPRQIIYRLLNMIFAQLVGTLFILFFVIKT
jgi:hypothetical protein